MKPVKLLDAAFLHGETAATPMHVGALFLLEGIPARARKSFFGRFRGMIGQQSNVKKAVVTLAEGHSIDVTTGL